VSLVPRSVKGTAILGVHVRRRAPSPKDGAAPGSRLLHANLVIDASGRGSQAPLWLAALGYDRPQETTVNAFVGYATRRYLPPAEFHADWKLLLLQATAPEGKRGGVLFPIEGGQWIAGLVGWARDYPPTDEAGFLAFARSLPDAALYDAIKDARPLTPIAGFRTTENRWRHYERLRHWPAGFLVLGDAVCGFNPVYGQGMTVVAQEALLLDQSLRGTRGRAGRSPAESSAAARRFQRRLARRVAVAWLMATNEDFRYPETEGGRPGPMGWLMHRYLDGVLQLANHSPAALRTFIEVSHLLKPPLSLFRPDIALGALRHAAQHAGGVGAS
jgi:hypothetical protein